MNTQGHALLYPLKTPVLFLIFNRLDTTKQVFQKICRVRPIRLYIASDGPKTSNPHENEKVKAVRDYVINNIDWECDVKTLFREKNLGCKYAVSSAISWFFRNEEMGIILEDDCLPSISFFKFCDELLEKYKDDLRIWHISGNNFGHKWRREIKHSYFFGGIYGSIWGWATWRSRWEKYDVEMKSFDKLKMYLPQCYDRSSAVLQRIKDFERVREGLDTWDYQWAYTRWINNGLTIIPKVNLVKNIGFGEGATHTKSKEDMRANMEIYEIEFPLKHPDFIIRDAIAELDFYNRFVKGESKYSMLAKKLKDIIRCRTREKSKSRP